MEYNVILDRVITAPHDTNVIDHFSRTGICYKDRKFIGNERTVLFSDFKAICQLPTTKYAYTVISKILGQFDSTFMKIVIKWTSISITSVMNFVPSDISNNIETSNWTMHLTSSLIELFIRVIACWVISSKWSYNAITWPVMQMLYALLSISDIKGVPVSSTLTIWKVHPRQYTQNVCLLCFM